MDCQKGKTGKFEVAPRRVTAENLPGLHFAKPLKDKAGFWAVASKNKKKSFFLHKKEF